MPSTAFAAELAAFGPDRPTARLPTLAESQAYCRRLARTHYENFTVASWLLPRELRSHFYHIYAYCRWADDLADETDSPEQSLELLDWWERELVACYDGRPQHPVFLALADTIRTFEIPIEPFRNLLVAFRQDQQTNRYETFDELLGYCRNSADPVGRLVLYLGRCHDQPQAELSDNVCTGLQLANFWQDVARDYDRGRIYLPRETQRRFGYDETMFARREANAAFRAALKFEVERAEEFLRRGLPLVDMVSPRLRGDVWLFIHGGLKILAHIRRLDFDVWNQRPEVSKREQLGLLAGYVLKRFGRRRAAARTGREPQR